MFKSHVRKKICISFDWHNDRNYRHLLSAWAANANNPVDFIDLTPGEIDTNAVDRVKAVLTTQIRAATHTLVLLGAHANTRHRDSVTIGTRNWIWWEIEKSKAEGKGLIAVRLATGNPTPDPLYNSGVKWATSFTQDEILKAINEA
ncbi:MAG: TIR domain-containing protein [Chloroflexota bacterium]|nr:TIR domain-containing protein [Chloroflexota bacterium]